MKKILILSIVILIVVGLFFSIIAIRSKILFDKVTPLYIAIGTIAIIFSGIAYDKYRKIRRKKINNK